ncbi:ABC transporter ATP-binding protein, partial [Mordavella massiliensis]|nr:ABC transporter ATP-binding protein [Mordavella massiliensis]MBM6972216.1 ABC transporter ATP-binding protein [Mordavella massiliensis]
RNYQKSALKKSDEDIKVLKGLNFSVEQGEFVGIMGKSGCGKTTLLKVLGMIDKQTDGVVRFMEKDTSKLYGDELADIRREQIGFVFQDFYLMDSLSVEENIMLPMILGQEKVDVMTKAARKYAEQFQISHLLKKNPYELSGGEKQRVAICRALINDPDLILADEPTGNLDSKSGQIVIDALVRINQEFGKTIVMVTHDPQMASYCSRIILLKDGVILDNLDHGDSQEAFYQEIIGRMADL